MANNPEAEWRESMYGHCTNTPRVVHESTTVWRPALPPPVPLLSAAKSAPSKQHSGAVDLDARASFLAAEHDLVLPSSIGWALLRQQWGRCWPDGRIEIAHAASTLPLWVLDHIIVHELAHLTSAEHDEEHDRLTARYSMHSEAVGYLLAVQDREWNVHRTPDNLRSHRAMPV